ncbi:MAG: hypothetical protein CL581_11010 [Alteromonadaceae bacterium]|nr:hypothetical protein [Alteromonadaceae bacterium]MAA65292.1 hypothetical protein [Alteromonadaceae bacterium]|tara:strand:- start:1136 stop:2236 length:1101 start_codon:yes stop_codon:yes gene_type:complete
MVIKVSPTGLDLDELSSLNLSDTPSSYGTTGQVLAVNAGADGLTFQTVSGGGTTAFTDLTDSPASLGTAGQYVAMNAGATALEFISPPSIPSVKNNFVQLDDTPANFTGSAGYAVRVNAAASGLEFVPASSLPQTFIGLSDTPDTTTGADGKFVKYSADTGELVFDDVNASVTPGLISFHDLGKTPSQNAANNGKYLRQKSDNSFDLEWVSVGGGSSDVLNLSDTPTTYGNPGQYLEINGESNGFSYKTPGPNPPIIMEVTHHETTVTSGANKYSFRMPYAAELTAVRASVNSAPTGAGLVVDINAGGTSVLGSNKLTINSGETTSTTSDVAVTINTKNLTDDQLISVDVDSVSGTPAGLKVTLVF